MGDIGTQLPAIRIRTPQPMPVITPPVEVPIEVPERETG